ncbi:hypothetical protein COJ85_07640 [Bacillus sp. AFS076308]|uniref:hypothetical protein n=1 Tax=Bacillus sp. AFS076308 TaxID=2033512 RepID=UPI000BF5A386|nr:hypothetical protein [Bacillus sp. AFS076308]PFO06202.1 hypothetical protein COJ85_07640 [Bacillus sp. AFS076308]
MADFEDGQDFKNQEEREEQIKADRFTSLMFGPRTDNNGQRSQHHSEPKQDSSIDYEALMTNIDTLVDSVRGLKPLFNKVYPFIEQLWKKK